MPRLITLIFILPLLLSSCNITGGDGAIRGVVYYNDEASLVHGPWVAIYQSSDPDNIYLLIQGDDEGRYGIILPEGDYIALGSSKQDGPFSGTTTAFFVDDGNTTIKKIILDLLPNP